MYQMSLSLPMVAFSGIIADMGRMLVVQAFQLHLLRGGPRRVLTWTFPSTSTRAGPACRTSVNWAAQAKLLKMLLVELLRPPRRVAKLLVPVDLAKCGHLFPWSLASYRR